MSQPIQFELVNAMKQRAFVDAFGSVFEHFPRAAAEAWTRRPFASASSMHDEMMNVILSLEAPAQRDFLNLHPLLSATNIRRGTMTADSDAEQKSAGLHSMSRDEEATLDRLNAAYLERHGFPFIICVRHYTREGIFSVFERRIGRDTQAETEEALAQIAAITRGRLDARLAALEPDSSIA